jgi:alpha-amylase/alpha-mannosidase (GH57 family)
MAGRLDLVLLWHMHQPEYRDPVSGEHVLPWVYLHALKDYTDMAAHLERHPAVRAVVNWVPVLIEQIDDYVRQFASGRFRDPLLALLARERLDDLDAGTRRMLIERCQQAYAPTMIDPFPDYRRLCELARQLGGAQQLDAYLSGQYWADLVTWYHLAWTGETVRRESRVVAELMARGREFGYQDRRRLLEAIGAELARVVERYVRLAQRGQIELALTPYCHPLAPLLVDFASAREAVPELALPEAAGYPGGSGRVRAQIDHALEFGRRRLGLEVSGMWPAEGAVSEAVLGLFAAAGCRWIASSASVLRNTLGRRPAGGRPAQDDAGTAGTPEHRAWRSADGLLCLFRDERLSDRIGFEFSREHSGAAARRLVAELEAIAHAAEAPPLVTIALDGENAWDRYPYNGYWFFEELYGLLALHPSIRLVTPGRDLGPGSAQRLAAGVLPPLVAGSWVHGTLTTWIGAPEKNRAWDLLVAARQAYDLELASGRLAGVALAQATRQLEVCEGSDWFWWYGDYSPGAAVASFDGLYRRQLARLYELIGVAPPAALARPIQAPGPSWQERQAEAGGTMRRAH